MKEIKIEVTQNCYHMCIHCSSDAKVKEYRNLDIAFVKELLKEAKELGMESVVFTGGEATLYQHLDEAIKYAKELDYYIKLYTMCNPINDNLQKLKHLNNLGLDEIIYSTSFSLAQDDNINFSLLKNFFSQILDLTNLKLGIHHVITNKTLDDLDPSLNLFLSLPNSQTTHFSILRYIPHGRGDETLLIDENKLKELKDYLEDKYLKYPNKIRLGSPWNILGITHTECNAALENMIVGFDGNVYPCDAMKYFNYLGSAGNAHNISLTAIYNSKYFEKIRKAKNQVSEDCEECSNFSLCKGGCLGQKMVSMMRKSFTFEDYHYHALRTMNDFEDMKHVKMNGEMGLVGEIGELIDIFKKYETHSLTDEKKEQLKENIAFELGDITWYLAASLSCFYQYSFVDIGNYLKGIPSYNKINNEIISLCAKEKDPLCQYQHQGLPLSILDNRITHYDISEDWKKLPIIACSIISTKEKEEVLKLASNLLVELAGIANNILKMSFTDVLQMNINKLQKRYQTGFDINIANARIEKYDQYKKEEPEKIKIYN